MGLSILAGLVIKIVFASGIAHRELYFFSQAFWLRRIGLWASRADERVPLALAAVYSSTGGNVSAPLAEWTLMPGTSFINMQHYEPELFTFWLYT